MKKLLLVSLCFLMLSITQVFAQNRTVTGTVKAKDDGLPIPGVTVKVKGTPNGTQTNSAGKFTLSVPAGASLTFTFVGYAAQTVPSSSVMNVTLVPASGQLGEVVVTGALGIKREAKEQGYAATQINNKSLTESEPTNFTNGLTAKAPGLIVTTVDNGINPTTRFTLRGTRHINGNNYALVVLNGTPVSPNEVDDINPDDIESVNILNGAGAAALYGSEASNGALVITTKRGSATGAPTVTYTNTFQIEQISYFPKLQNEFGSYGGEGGQYQDPVTGFIIAPVPYENQSYGPKYTGALTQLGIPLADGTIQEYPYSTPAKDPRQAFFQTGHSDQNSVSYASGDATNGFNFSASRVDRTGTLPMDTYNRSTARVSGTKTSGIFTMDATASFTQSNTSTSANNGGYYSYDDANVLNTILNTPSWVPIENFKNINQPFADVNTYFNAYGVNPYWLINNSRTNTRTDVFNGNFNGTAKFTKWLDASYRLSYSGGVTQIQATRAEADFSEYALGNSNTVGGQIGANVPGYVQNITQFGDGGTGALTSIGGAGPQGYSRIQQDEFLNFHHTFFHDFKTTLLLGNTIWQEYANETENSSANLLVDNFYNIGSILGTPETSQTTYKIRQIAYFADATIGYKDFAFLEGSLRNDHDSRLAAANRSFFYPSVKGSVVLTDAIPELKDNKYLSFLKVRASYTQVGDVNVVPYGINNTFSPTSGFPYGSVGGLSLSQTLNNPNLKPELTNELEFGADFGFWDDRVSASATYYTSKTKDQTLSIATSPSTGYTNTLINVGEVANQGYEFKADVQVLTKAQNGVGLDLGGNLTIQSNKVISLFGNTKQITIGGYPNAAVEAVVGKSFPVLYGTDLNRDPQGRVIVDPATGYPSLNSNLTDLGALTPNYIIGLTQSVSYKFITLTAVSEFRTGNVIYNEGESEATTSGESALSASAGRERFIFPNSVINTGTASAPVYTPNHSVSIQDGNIGFWDGGAYSEAASTYVTSGAFWKLREADLAFDISKWTRKSKWIKKTTFSLIGRNLVMLRPKTNNWTDPEFSYSAGNNGPGINNTNQNPPSRFYGASLNVTF
ncbi:SusC/RagA family TonB-linked outer membrane protein [Mucilaginibacter sp.]